MRLTMLGLSASSLPPAHIPLPTSLRSCLQANLSVLLSLLRSPPLSHPHRRHAESRGGQGLLPRRLSAHGACSRRNDSVYGQQRSQHAATIEEEHGAEHCALLSIAHSSSLCAAAAVVAVRHYVRASGDELLTTPIDVRRSLTHCCELQASANERACACIAATEISFASQRSRLLSLPVRRRFWLRPCLRWWFAASAPAGGRAAIRRSSLHRHCGRGE